MIRSQSAEWSFNYKSVIELETKLVEVNVVNKKIAQAQLKVKS